MQDDLNHTMISGHPSRPASRNAFDENTSALGSAEAELAHLYGVTSSDLIHSTSNIQSSSGASAPALYSYAAALGASLSRSSTPEPQRIARAPSPCPTPIGGGRAGNSEKNNINSSFNGVPPHSNESADLVAALSGMNLSNGIVDNIEPNPVDHKNYLFNRQGSQNNIKQQAYMKRNEIGQFHTSSAPDSGANYGGGSHFSRNTSLQSELQNNAVRSNNSYLKGSSNAVGNGGGSPFLQYQQLDSPNASFSNYGLSDYPMSPIAGQLGRSNLPPLFENAAAASAMATSGIDSRMFGGSSFGDQDLSRLGNQMAGGVLQAPYVDPYLQYLAAAEYTAAQVAALSDSSVDRNYMGNSYVDLLQQAYYGNLLSPQKSQYGAPFGSKNGSSSPHGFYSNPTMGIGLSYPGSPLSSPVIPNSSGGPGSPMRLGEFGSRFPAGMQNVAPWHLDTMGNGFGSSLLEEFKSNKTRCFELSDICGHVVEFRYVFYN